MVAELASVSLMDHLSEPGFRASLITTYNCYFPFYEEVVLRRLVAGGCVHNVLMVDAARCAEAFADDALRPRRAGRDYTLIPVPVKGGVFHPKILLRVGKSKGALYVGSHNVTLSGFGLNDELTNVFRAGGTASRGAATPFRQALDFLAQFIPRLSDVEDAYRNISADVPWLGDASPAQAAQRRLLTTASLGPDLWSQLRGSLPDAIDTLLVCGPFFDTRLEFLRRLQTDVRPRRLVVAVDPATVEIEPAARRDLGDVRFVNAAHVERVWRPENRGAAYLHAKLLFATGKHGKALVTGSANPSAPAFLSPSSGRNAEAVVLDLRPSAGRDIGVEALLEAPEITPTEWAEVAARVAEKPPAPPASQRRRVVVATASETGLVAQEGIEDGAVLRAFGGRGELLGHGVVRRRIDGTSIETTDDVLADVRYLDDGDANQLLVLVHHTPDISRNFGSDTRKALRRALGALEEDPAQLETLLKLTEKVIFDSDDVVRLAPPRASRSAAAPSNDSSASLALDAQGRRSSRRRPSLASGDIVVLLDALMRRLGDGTSGPSGVQERRLAEEQIGVDEEDGGLVAQPETTNAVLARACRAKVKRLVARMVKLLESDDDESSARRAVVQLAAVLSVVRALRVIEQRSEWRSKGLKLIDRDDEWHLLEHAAYALGWGEDALAPRAVAEAAGEAFDELVISVGLTAWLAWECEIDVPVAAQQSGRRGVEEESWYGAQLFASVGALLATYDDAEPLVRDAVARTPRFGVDSDRWLSAHVDLALAVADVVATAGTFSVPPRPPCPGDLVILHERFTPRVRVIYDVEPTAGDRKITFYDPYEDDCVRTFLGSKVVTVPWARTVS